jgi:mRNA interferase MazF
MVVCPLTTDLLPSKHVRPTIYPSIDNGLRATSQVMVDKVIAIHIRRTRDRVGRLLPAEMERVEYALAVVLGLVK